MDPNRGISEVRVGKGVYKPDQDEAASVTPGDREATFQMHSGLTIRGSYRGLAGGGDPDDRDTDMLPSVLSGDLASNDIPDLLAGLRCFSFDGNPCETGCESFDADGDTDVDAEDLGIDENSYHVVTSSGTDATAVLDGFTITAGNADDTPRYAIDGGGMYNADDGQPTVSNCTFAVNRAKNHGGGTYVHNGNPTLTGCTFSGNWAEFGAGTNIRNGTTVLTDCMFNRNHADVKCGGLANEAGLTLLGCTFTENSSIQEGGGVFHASPGDVVASDCSFFGNSSWHGGGVQLQYGDNIFVNCLFSGNSAENGGAISIRRGDGRRDTTMTNCTLAGNQAGDAGAGVYTSGSGFLEMSVANCILWGNIDAGGSDESAQIDNHLLTDLIVTYSCVQGCSTYCTDPNSHNIHADPLFADANGADDVPGTPDDDLRLSLRSPCIDTGNNNADTNLRTPEVEPLPDTDLDGRDRIFDGNRDGVATVDMGAYEFTSAYSGDLDGQYDVDFADYSILAAYWLEDHSRVDIGGAPGGDGIIDYRDLAVLAAHWLEDILP